MTRSRCKALGYSLLRRCQEVEWVGQQYVGEKANHNQGREHHKVKRKIALICSRTECYVAVRNRGGSQRYSRFLRRVCGVRRCRCAPLTGIDGVNQEKTIEILASRRQSEHYEILKSEKSASNMPSSGMQLQFHLQPWWRLSTLWRRLILGRLPRKIL